MSIEGLGLGLGLGLNLFWYVEQLCIREADSI